MRMSGVWLGWGNEYGMVVAMDWGIFVLVVFNLFFIRLYRNFLVSLSLILCKLR